MTLQFLIGPLVGAIIGYITNSIAIKMLFRPLNPIYLFGKRLPFTPGMIPKEKARIAKTIGQVVGTELLDSESLKKQLLSQDMYVKFERGINEWFMTHKNSTKTVGLMLEGATSPQLVESLKESMEDKISTVAFNKLVDLDLGAPLAADACEAIKGNLGPLAMFVNDSLLATAKEKLEVIINEMIKEKGYELINQVVEKEGQNLLDTPVEDLLGMVEAELPKIKYALLKQYTYIIENQLDAMIASIDLAKIVEDKINGFDTLEMEKIIMSIMKKELNAIVWLGALLGGLMGIIMGIF